MEKSKKYVLLAPDGGWGYIVLIGVILNLAIISCISAFYGIIFNDYFITLKMASTHVTLINGINSISMALAGFSTAPLLKFMSQRNLFYLATVALNSGLLITVFVQSQVTFFLFQIIQSFGVGMLYNLNSSIVNEYFVQKRVLAISVMQTVIAILCFVAPLLFNWCFDVFGSRGTLLVLCCLTVHMFIAATNMHPVKWHMRKVEISANDVETKLLIEEKIKKNEIMKAGEANNNICSVKETDGFLQAAKNLIDVKLIGTFALSFNCLGTGLCTITDLLFILMLPQALQAFGWNDAEIAWAFSLISLGDLLTRIILIILNKWMIKIENRYIYIAGIFIGFGTRLVILSSDNKTLMLSFFTIMGVSRCILMIIIVLVVADAVGPDQFTPALGIFMMVNGMMTFCLGPLTGIIRDYTSSYRTAYYLLTSILGIVGISWTSQIIYKNYSTRRRTSS